MAARTSTKTYRDSYTPSFVSQSRRSVSSTSSLSSSDNYSLYTWGTNSSGSLLQGDDNDGKVDSKGILWEPHVADGAKLCDGEKIIDVSCGHSETMIITEGGRVWVAGANKNGQLGLGHTDPVPIPTELTVDGVGKFRKGVTGINTGALIAEHGDLYTFGFGGSALQGFGCLGHGDGESYLTPKLVESLVEDGCQVVDVALGESHTTVLTSEGEVLTTGAANYGRLGNGETSEDTLYFDEVEILPSENITQIAGGESFTLALTDEGVIYGWGKNAKGQLGTGYGMAVDLYAMEQIPTPMEGDELANRTVTKIAAGTNHSACVTSSGELFWWGSTLHLEPVRVTEVLHTKIIDVACGLDYTLALSEDHEVYVWGVGKTGVLGVGPDTKNLHQAQRIRSLMSDGDEDEKEIVSLSAGSTLAACLVKES
eukprot:CAMPEP_0197192270 /NCGR_PEP_ID=MMETSP1423-20130617/24796_1 /TAXON_ID=476441 /ORGANISM="Pseudo-nitzschia heimii, Strain UNC1101" /LENGTH=425 /DNA_ID=CAMNT_0042645121 /DNA_START=138 /DNA_END=1415 /DNA_ORIENTATION=+